MTPRMRSATARSARRRDGGQSLVEFALMAPILVILVFGIVDLSRAFQSYVTLQEAARSAARYAVTGRIDCTGPAIQNRDTCIRNEATEHTKNLDSHSTVVTAYRSWHYPNYADPPVQGNAGNQCDAVEVELTYDFHPMTPLFNFFVSHVAMDARERMVNEPFGSCS